MEEMSIEALFKPRSVAVVGASGKPGKIGYAIMKNLIEYGYEGKIYAVNVKGGEIEVSGRKFKVYESILDVPDEVDMAVVVVPAKFVSQVVEECGKKGVKVLPIISSGFGELGEEGKKVEEQLVETAHKYGMRILGPNIFGIVYTPAKLNATFGPTDVLPGKLALVSQSGALGIALMGWTILEKVGLSAVVSIGNKSDLDDADMLEYFENDENTGAILIYMEGVKDGRKFMETAKRVSMKKPIIIIKAGRSERGAKAAASHTGSLAGADSIYTAAFKQSGVLRALTIGEAFDWARTLSNLPEPEGENVVIITNGGGIGVMATDAAEEEDLKLYDNLEELKVFANHMPPFGSYKNPVDLTGMADAKAYEGAVRDALANPNMDAVAVLYCQTAVLDPRDLAKIVIEEYEASGRKKPLVVAIVGGIEAKEAIDLLNERGIPAYPEPERAIKSLSALYRWHNWKMKHKKE
ncbi:Acetyl-CoA synthetase I (ACSI, ADP-forming), subunit alpha [Thermococcus sibiricus MM 739]|uniref:acetate--CoA ligase (ADP-forming) n=2 Tax=Thermococcus sibiricus TaxID=172049 RepID=C6A1V0_THESM|nr:Acetyl-CoA synthetase I (ACSI, ADP-forming), subunit alpha [Thermococcus sibiricus MM 739]